MFTVVLLWYCGDIQRYITLLFMNRTYHKTLIEVFLFASSRKTWFPKGIGRYLNHLESWKFEYQLGGAHHQLLWLPMVSLNLSFLTTHGSRSIPRSRFSSHHVYTQVTFTCGPRLNPGDLQAQQLGHSSKSDETRNVPGFQD